MSAYAKRRDRHQMIFSHALFNVWGWDSFSILIEKMLWLQVVAILQFCFSLGLFQINEDFSLSGFPSFQKKTNKRTNKQKAKQTNKQTNNNNNKNNF